MLTPSGSQADDLVLDAELGEDERRDRRGGAVGAVDEHAQAGTSIGVPPPPATQVA